MLPWKIIWSFLETLISIGAVHVWEVDFFTPFFNMLYSFIMRWGSEDKLCWTPSKRGLFDVRPFYNVLSPIDSTHFLWKSIWWNNVLLKVTCFARSAAFRKIFTMDNLRKQHIIVVDMCCICRKSGESVDHLLLHCEIASAFWNTIFNLFGLD
jgi:hypothetical protein